MRMIFKSVKIHNFMSYEDAELSLDRHGYVLVNGINNNPIDNAKSNGVGKSSLFSAISWALTGLTMSGGKDVANIYLSGTTSAELSFSVDGTEYVVIRTKNPSNLKLFVNGEDKSGKGIRDTEKLLSEYLPDVTYVLLSSVIILGQGLPQKFTSNTPSGRKDVLEKLSNSDFMITDLKDRVSKRGTYLKTSLRELENEITDLSARKDMTERQLETYTQSLSEYTDSELHSMERLLESYNSVLAERTKEVEELISTITEKETLLDELHSTMVEANEKYENGKSELPIDTHTELDTKIYDTTVKINSLQSEIKRLDTVTDVCPTCGQKLPNVTKIDTTDKKEELETLKKELEEYKSLRLEIEKKNALIYDEYKRAFDEKQKENKKVYSDLSYELTILKRNKTDKEGNVQRISTLALKVSTNIEKFEEKKEELKNEINGCKSRIIDYNNRIGINTEKSDNLQLHLDVNNKMSTILTRDFRGYLLLSVIEFISDRAKKYSIDLFNTENLNFELDGNNIMITYDGKDYDMLSGGEKQKIDVIIQLSIRDMLCSYLNFSSNILVLDEITDSLDIVGSQKMFNLISKKLNDVEAVYIISHHQDDFEIPYDEQIKIVKGVDKISRLVSV